MEGYRAAPGDGGPGVLVLHAWWGLNDDVRAFADGLSTSGFVVHAPDLFSGVTATTASEATALHKALDRTRLNAELLKAAAALAAASSTATIGVVGFSLGANWAVSLAKYRPDIIDRLVLYYGKGTGSLGKVRARILVHLAETDDFLSNFAGFRANVDKAEIEMTVHQYSGTGHWFAEPSVADAYDATAAASAFQRTLTFLRSG